MKQKTFLVHLESKPIVVYGNKIIVSKQTLELNSEFIDTHLLIEKIKQI